MLKRLSLCAVCVAGFATPSMAGPDLYLGEIMLVPYNFCPRGTRPAQGQTLPISTNSALFSLLGTMYGGNGRTTFALPDWTGGTPYETWRYCIATEGVYPSRS